MPAPVRRYVLFTDDEDEAFAELRSRRSASTIDHEGYRGWDMAAVQDLTDPPKTAHKFCVFQSQENK
jgi:hypothetical protein